MRTGGIRRGSTLLYMDMNGKASNARKTSALSVAVAAQLRAERAIANFTVEDLARRSGVSRNTLLKILNSQVTADVSQLDAICRALDVPILDLFTRAEARMATGGADAAKVAGE